MAFRSAVTPGSACACLMTTDCERTMPSLPRARRPDDPNAAGRPVDGQPEPGTEATIEIDGRQRQNAVLAERDPASVASVLAAFRRRRGFERSSLAAWLRLSPD